MKSKPSTPWWPVCNLIQARTSTIQPKGDTCTFIPMVSYSPKLTQKQKQQGRNWCPWVFLSLLYGEYIVIGKSFHHAAALYDYAYYCTSIYVDNWFFKARYLCINTIYKLSLPSQQHILSWMKSCSLPCCVIIVRSCLIKKLVKSHKEYIQKWK